MNFGKKFVNLTPHEVVVVDGIEYRFPASGTVARVTEITEEAPRIGGFRVVRKTYGEVTDLPEPAPDTVYIVSALVREAAKRSDLVSPDSGKDAIRNEKGQIIAVRGFVQ